MRKQLAIGLVAAGLLAAGAVGTPTAEAAPAPLRAELDAYLAGSSGSSDLTFPGMPWPATAPGPYIDRVQWVNLPSGPSLQIYPTAAGRRATGFGLPGKAWREVLALAANAATPGMRAQFDCHWVFVRLVEPGKPSWNLEPGRAVVGPIDMVASACNPPFVD
ncbi:DUF2599 domain-containing protein [Gordonia phosphorivorans]|uniref:DUF2599 domain-containing protein n=1 Tax=Gordonia phosphorivorans TaxID=1056982 RepID=A0ABV6HBR3_9ACTN